MKHLEKVIVIVLQTWFLTSLEGYHLVPVLPLRLEESKRSSASKLRHSSIVWSWRCGREGDEMKGPLIDRSLNVMNWDIQQWHEPVLKMTSFLLGMYPFRFQKVQSTVSLSTPAEESSRALTSITTIT